MIDWSKWPVDVSTKAKEWAKKINARSKKRYYLYKVEYLVIYERSFEIFLTPRFDYYGLESEETAEFLYE